MRLSRFFAPTLKENPTEAQIVSHRLMLRAGMIRQHAAGIYNWLPLGTMVLNNIARIVRENSPCALDLPHGGSRRDRHAPAGDGRAGGLHG